MSEAYSVAFCRETDFGTLAAVHLPAGKEPVPAEVLARLHEAERSVVANLSGYRQIEWAGARLAWHAACAARGRPRAPLLSSEDRAPIGPSDCTASVTHKRDLALALVADAAEGTVGIDLEGDGRSRMVIAPKVLRPEELVDVEKLPLAEQWPATELRFALKEATYKAIFPHLRRYVAFHECAVTLRSPSDTALQMFLRPGEPNLSLEGTWQTVGSRVLALVRARVLL